jgi:hypothetical protein
VPGFGADTSNAGHTQRDPAFSLSRRHQPARITVMMLNCDDFVLAAPGPEHFSLQFVTNARECVRVGCRDIERC